MKMQIEKFNIIGIRCQTWNTVISIDMLMSGKWTENANQKIHITITGYAL